MEKAAPVQSVRKALDILDLVVEAGISSSSASLSALAEKMAMPRNSVHNLLKTLVACGYVEQRERGMYSAGIKCRQLVRLSRFESPAAREAITARMRKFANDQGEACLLVSLVNGERVVISYVDCDQAVRVSHATIEKIPFYEKPTGRLLAAIAGDLELQQILQRHGLPGAQWNDINDEQSLRDELAELRRQGYCQVDHENGLAALACPVAAEGEQAWGVVGTYAPGYRCPPQRKKELLKALRTLASELAAAVV